MNMAIKYFCDQCQNEIKGGELSGEFRMLEYDLSGKVKEPVLIKYLLCYSCSKALKQKIIEPKSQK